MQRVSGIDVDRHFFPCWLTGRLDVVSATSRQIIQSTFTFTPNDGGEL